MWKICSTKHFDTWRMFSSSRGHLTHTKLDFKINLPLMYWARCGWSLAVLCFCILVFRVEGANQYYFQFRIFDTIKESNIIFAKMSLSVFLYVLYHFHFNMEMEHTYYHQVFTIYFIQVFITCWWHKRPSCDILKFLTVFKKFLRRF